MEKNTIRENKYMKFPELKIIDKIPNKGKTDEKELLVVQLDWSELDNHKIKSRKNWYMKYGISDSSKEEKLALEQLLDEVDWSEYLYPTEYKYLFEKYSQFNISQHYYDECQYLMERALSEWERVRPFDTNVRETLLEPAFKYIESYFYMIGDAIYIYNPDFKPSGIKHIDVKFEKFILIRSLFSFRFWKFQTGGRIVVDKSTEFVKKWRYDTRFEKEVKPILESNVMFEPMNELKTLVGQKLRDNKLNQLINQ